MGIENVIIGYKADTSDIIKQLKNIQRLNSVLAKQIGVDFSKGFSVVNSELKKVQFDKKFKIKTDKGFKKVSGDIRTFQTTIKNSDGQLLKLNETLGISANGTTKLATSLTKVTQAQSKLAGQSSALKTNFSKLNSINANFSQQLKSVGTASKFLGTSLNQISNDGTKVSKIFETTNGKFVQLTETVKKLPNGVNKVSRSVKQLSKDQVQNIKTVEGMNKSTRSLGANLKTLLTRAALTIPVWFALRQGIGSVFRTIKDGIRDIIAFDRALQKLRRNMEATSTNLERDFVDIQKTITDFSLKTGKSVEEITNAIQKFATVGFGIETSLVGGLKSIQLAVTLFGEGEETAQAFARSMRVMTEGMTDAEEKQGEIARALAKTDQLWQTNAFEVNEFSANLTKFAGTAKIANLSIQDTLALIATLSTGGLGQTSGRLLTGTILRALKNIPKITRVLSLDFDPKKQSTTEFILEMVSALKTLRAETNKAPAELAGVLGEIFTIRSTKIIASLVALEKTLKENLALEPNLKKFDATFERLLTKPGSLAEQFTNLNREMGKAFVQGLVGADNFENSLQSIVNTQSFLNDHVEKFGGVVKNSFIISGVSALIIFKGQWKKLGLFLLAHPLALGSAVAVATTANLITEFKRLRRESDKASKSLANVGIDFAKQMEKAFAGDLNFDEIDELINKLEVFGAKQIGFDEPVFNKALKALREIRVEEENIAIAKKDTTEEGKKNILLEQKKKKISEIILANELEILKSLGTQNSEIIKKEQILRKIFNIEKTELDQLRDQLDIQKEINQEKELGTSLSSRTQKLAEIGRTEGIETARKIGDVLRGAFDFDLFERIGGKNLEIFKKEFGDIFKEQQDIKFLQGKGFRIPVARTDQATVRGDTGRIRTRASLGVLRAEAFVKGLQKSSVNTDQNTIATIANTQSIKQLKSIFEQGGIVKGADIVRARDAENELSRQQNIARIQDRLIKPSGVISGTQEINLNIDISGQQLSLSGTPDEIRNIAKNLAPEIIPIVERAIAHTLKTNNSAPISKATDGRIDKF